MVVRASWPVTLEGWLERCESSHPRAIDLGLERVRVVKDRLQLTFQVPVIVVAGTNGKGSTCAMLERLAIEAGWRVGLYSKPHLVDFAERCRVQGEMVEASALVSHFAAVEAARGSTSLTYFEHSTLAILRLLSRRALDLVILEVGMGGRLDAVNVIDADCAVITSVGIDHVEHLGSGREAIGREKAGIMRSGRSVVIGDASPPDSVVNHGEALGASMRRAGHDFQSMRQATGLWRWQGWNRTYDALPVPALLGDCQLQNAATALAALACLDVQPRIDDEAVRRAMLGVRLPGRFEVLPGSPRIVLDVAHNREAVQALAARLRSFAYGGRTLAVFGCMHDKEVTALIGEMALHVDHWYLTGLPVARAATVAELMERAADTLAPAHVTRCASPEEALHKARASARPEDTIVVFGSFHTVGAVRRS